MNANAQQLNKQVDDLLARWRNSITQPGKTNRPLAEESIRQIYRTAGCELKAIVWCESPFQTAVLPTLVMNAIHAQPFDERAATSLFNSISDHANFETVPPDVKSRARVLFRQTMEQIAREGKLKSGGYFAQQRGSATPRPSKKIMRDLFALSIEIDSTAGVELSIATAPLSIVGVMMGIWDQRIVSGVTDALSLPFADRLKKLPAHHSEVQKRARQIKEKFQDLELAYRQFMTWYTGLPMPVYAGTPDVPQISTENGWWETARAVGAAVGASNKEVREARAARSMANNASFVALPYYAASLPFALACRFIRDDFFGELQERIDTWAFLSHASAGATFCEDVCFVLEKPSSVSVDSQLRIHNDSGPAMTWNDGLKIYSWHGIVVPPRIIEARDSITVDEITSQRNAELRRVLMTRFGEARYIQEVGAKVIDDNPEYGLLYRIEMRGDEAIVMVKVRNSTPEPDGTFKHYFLRVPPNTMTAHQAVAWTFGMNEREYKPSVQT